MSGRGGLRRWLRRILPARVEVLLLGSLLVVTVLLTLTGSRPAWLNDPPAAASDQRSPDQRVDDPASIGRPDGIRVVVPGPPSLRPGVGYPLDVQLENTNRGPVLLTGVEVMVSDVHSPGATADRPCGLADFRTRPARFPAIELPAGASTSLTAAGIPRRGWPVLAMLDSEVNQDGCQGSELTLSVRVEGTME